MSSSIEILAPELATAATRTSDRFLTHDVRSLIVNVRAENYTDSPEFFPKIQIQMGDRWVDYWETSRAFTSEGDYIYVLHGGQTGFAGIFYKNPPPFSWRFVLTFSGTGSGDTFVGAQVLTT